MRSGRGVLAELTQLQQTCMRWDAEAISGSAASRGMRQQEEAPGRSNEVAQCRAAQERDAGRAHALQHELQQACQLAEERSRELTQLQEVSVQADAALQQCLAQLQVHRAVRPCAKCMQLLCVWQHCSRIQYGNTNAWAHVQV